MTGRSCRLPPAHLSSGRAFGSGFPVPRSRICSRFGARVGTPPLSVALQNSFAAWNRSVVVDHLALQLRRRDEVVALPMPPPPCRQRRAGNPCDQPISRSRHSDPPGRKYRKFGAFNSFRPTTRARAQLPSGQKRPYTSVTTAQADPLPSSMLPRTGALRRVRRRRDH